MATENPPPTPKQRSGLWENENLSQIPFKVFRGHKEGLNSCMFCFENRKVLTSSDDHSVKLWDATSGDVVRSYKGYTHQVSYCKLSKDNTSDFGRIISSSWDKSICMWDTETGSVLWRRNHEGLVTSCDISNDQKTVISASDLDYSINIWDANEGTVVNILKVNLLITKHHGLFEHHNNTPMWCEFSPNSDRISSTGMDMTTKVWDIKSAKTTATLNGHTNIVACCHFSPNERYLATASWDKGVRVWDISTGMYRSQGSNLLTKGHEGSVSCCKFSSDSQLLLSGGYDKSVVIWDLSNFTKKLVLRGHDGWVTGVDVSSDKRWILSSSKDGTLRIWNIEAMDHIPVVLENKKALGLKITQCEQCGKSFSIAQIDDPAEIRTCVFCRLADPSRNTLPSIL